MYRSIGWIVLIVSITFPLGAQASALTTGARETAEYMLQKFGKRVPAQTSDDLAREISRASTRHGDEAVGFLRSAGHSGFDVLEQAGTRAPDVIKLFVRRGDEAVWLVSKPEKLAIFIKHGDSAADALIKHPGIADALITRHGRVAAEALNRVSQQGAQRLGIVAQDGLLSATSRSPELLDVIRRYGDTAMDFIWKHKGSLAVVTALGGFLADPEAYFSGAKGLAEAVPGKLLESIGKSGVLSLIFGVILMIALLPFIVRSTRRAIAAWRGENPA